MFPVELIGCCVRPLSDTCPHACLRGRRNLQRLNLSDNTFGIAGATALAEALKLMPSMRCAPCWSLPRPSPSTRYV
jgi:Ran GTPase-activating protein (RanGAP) involved in mRNA processing and transport